MPRPPARSPRSPWPRATRWRRAGSWWWSRAPTTPAPTTRRRPADPTADHRRHHRRCRGRRRCPGRSVGPGRLMAAPLRIANCSGFYGDRLSAAREMVEGGPIDVLTGDWLAELTMLILWKGRQRDAGTRLGPHLPDPDGGRPRHLRRPGHQGGHQRRRAQPRRPGRAGHGAGRPRWASPVDVAYVEGDDLLARLAELARDGHHLGSPGHRPAAGRRSGPGDLGQRLPRGMAHRRGPQRRGRRGGVPAGSPTRPSWWGRRPGTTAGAPPTGTGWPGRWWPDTSSSAGPRPPAATTPSSPRCTGWSTRASRSPRWRRTAPR